MTVRIRVRGGYVPTPVVRVINDGQNYNHGNLHLRVCVQGDDSCSIDSYMINYLFSIHFSIELAPGRILHVPGRILHVPG